MWRKSWVKGLGGAKNPSAGSLSMLSPRKSAHKACVRTILFIHLSD